MKVSKQFNKLCTPAQIYLLISIVSIVSLFSQNYKHPKIYCVGMFKANTTCNNLVYFALKIFYTLIWTYILHLLCKKGYESISWFLVLLPFIGMFILIGVLLFNLIHHNGAVPL